MNWLHTMQDDDTVASSDADAGRPSISPDTTSRSWDPHEVWLTRIKQPRELAARRSMGSPLDSLLGAGT